MMEMKFQKNVGLSSEEGRVGMQECEGRSIYLENNSEVQWKSNCIYVFIGT